jgi:hypothetical protein
LQMLQFEVLQSPEQHISLFHTADDFPPITAQQALNNLNSTFYQNSLSEQKYKFIQDVINPAHKFIQFFNSEINFLHAQFASSQACRFKNSLMIELNLEFNPILAIQFSSFHSEEPPHK